MTTQHTQIEGYEVQELDFTEHYTLSRDDRYCESCGAQHNQDLHFNTWICEYCNTVNQEG